VARADAYLHAKFHLIRPTVSLQYTNVTDNRQTTSRWDKANRFYRETLC